MTIYSNRYCLKVEIIFHKIEKQTLIGLYESIVDTEYHTLSNSTLKHFVLPIPSPKRTHPEVNLFDELFISKSILFVIFRNALVNHCYGLKFWQIIDNSFYSIHSKMFSELLLHSKISVKIKN